MSREDCKEILSLVQSDCRYFRRYRHSSQPLFKALCRVPGSIAMIRRRKALASALESTPSRTTKNMTPRVADKIGYFEVANSEILLRLSAEQLLRRR